MNNIIAIFSILSASFVAIIFNIIQAVTDIGAILEIAKNVSSFGFLVLVIYILWQWLSGRMVKQDDNIVEQHKSHIADLKEEIAYLRKVKGIETDKE